MEKHSIIICILLAIITTNLIRVVPMRHHRPGHRHHRSLAPSGTFPRRRHLLRHRLSDRYPDTLITTHSNPIPPTLSQIPLPV